jgi:hypothetical protein
MPPLVSSHEPGPVFLSRGLIPPLVSSHQPGPVGIKPLHRNTDPGF